MYSDISLQKRNLLEEKSITQQTQESENYPQKSSNFQDVFFSFINRQPEKEFYKGFEEIYHSVQINNIQEELNKSLKFPQEIQEFIQENSKYVIDYLEPIRVLLIYAKNKLYQLKYDPESTQNEMTFSSEEFPFFIKHIEVCKIRSDFNILYIYTKDQVSHFYAQTHDLKMMDTKITLPPMKINQVFYDQYSNQFYIVSKNQIQKIRLNIINQKYNLIDIHSKEENWFSKSINTLSNYASKTLFTFIKQKESLYFKFKSFKNLLVIHKQVIGKNKKVINDHIQILKKEKNKLITITEISLNQILALNHIILENIEASKFLFQDDIYVIDFLLDDFNPIMTLLCNHQIEISFNILKHSINRVYVYNFFDQVSNLEFSGYFDKNNFLANKNGSYILINKSKCAMFASQLISPNLTGYMYYDMRDIKLISPLKRQQSIICSRLKQIVINSTEVKTLTIYNEEDYLYNLLLFGYYNQNQIPLRFFEYLEQIQKTMTNEHLCKLLLNCLFMIQTNETFEINDFQKYLEEQFLNDFTQKQPFKKDKVLFNFLYFLNIFNSKENQGENLMNQKLVDKILLKKIHKFLLLNNQENIICEEDNKLSLSKSISNEMDVFLSFLRGFLEIIYYVEASIKTDSEFYLDYKKFYTSLSQHSFYTNQNVSVIDKCLISSETKETLERFLQIYQFFEVLKTSEISDSNLQILEMYKLSDIIFNPENDIILKKILIQNSSLYTQKHSEVYQKFLNQKEIRALILLEEYLKKNDFSQSKMFQKDNFIETLSCLQYFCLENFTEKFWERDEFMIFLRIQLKRLEILYKDSEGQMNEIQNIETFLISVLYIFIKKESKNNSLNTWLINKSVQLVSKTKQFLFKITEQNPQFCLEKELLNLPELMKVEMFNEYISLLFRFPHDNFRQNVLTLLFQHRQTKIIENNKSQTLVKDIEQISKQGKIFEGNVGLKNSTFIMNMLLKEQRYTQFLEVLMKLFNRNKFLDKIKNIFKQKGSLIDDVQELLKEIREVQHLPLNALLCYIQRAYSMQNFVDKQDKKVENIFKILCDVELLIKINLILKKELKKKKEFIEKIFSCCENKDQIANQQYIDYLDLLIEIVELNPNFKTDLMEEIVVQPNKLHYVLIDSLILLQKPHDPQSILMKTKELIIHYGIMNQENVFKVAMHFDSSLFKNKYLIQQYKKISLQQLREKNLVFPYNLDEKIQDYIKIILDNAQEIPKQMLQEFFQTIEQLNINNDIFQDFLYEKKENKLIEKSIIIWHFFYFQQLFNEEESQSKFENIILVICLYFDLFSQTSVSLNTFNEDNLRYKYIHSYLVLFNFSLNQIRKIGQKQEPSFHEKQFVVKFVEKSSIFEHQLMQFKQFSPQLLNHNKYLSSFFKFQDQITQLIHVNKSILQMQNIQKIRKHVMENNQLFQYQFFIPGKKITLFLSKINLQKKEKNCKNDKRRDLQIIKNFQFITGFYFLNEF